MEEIKKIQDIVPDYKNKRAYNIQKMPRRQNIFLRWLAWTLSKMTLIGTKYKIDKINMEGLKPPYLLLCNHISFVDFKINMIATHPYAVNNIASIDGFYKRSLLMEFLGCIATRKFTKDIALVKQIQYCIKKYKSIMSLYPEARYSPIGMNSKLPDSIGKLAKSLGVPVVILKNHGDYLRSPFWDYKSIRKVPLYATMTQILTKEDLEKYTNKEINKIIEEKFEYNDYKWQRDNQIKVKNRIKGIHKVLYQCPNCKKEHQMNTDNKKLWCENCKKEWTIDDYGVIRALDGNTEFNIATDWFNWQREEVRKQILDGTYIYEDIVDTYSLKRPQEFFSIGKAKLIHDIHGFRLEGEHNNKKYIITRPPLSMYSLHVEYDFIYFKHIDCIDLSTINDTFYCFTSKPNVVTKLGLAVEELYKINTELANSEE